MSSSTSLILNHIEGSLWSKHALHITTPKSKYQEGASSVGPPLPRVWHSSSIVPSSSGDVFIFGGGVDDQAKNDTWAIRVSGDLESDLPLGSGGNYADIRVTASLLDATGDIPSSRGAHVSALLNGALVIWGGIASTKGDELELSDGCVYLLNTTTYNWKKLDIQPAPRARAWHAACICENKFVVFGGGISETQYLNDLWSLNLYSPGQMNPMWERIDIAPGTMCPPEQVGHAMVAYESKLYVFGGYDGETIFNDVWCFDMNTRTWTKLTCTGCIPPSCTAHAVALVGDVVYMFGGEDKIEEVLGDTWGFKLNEQRWYKFPHMDLQPSARHGHTMIAIEGRVLVVGGMREDAGRSGDMTLVHALNTSIVNYPEQGEEIALKSLPEKSLVNTNEMSAETDSSSMDKLAATTEGLGANPAVYLEESDSHPEQTPTVSINGEFIKGAMSATEILQRLDAHHCRDISKELDILRVSELPVSTGGFGDVYCATLRNGDRVALKCIRMQVGCTPEGEKFLKKAAHELYVWSKCKHSNVLELSGVMLFRGRVAMVSPWVENGHLRWFLEHNPQANRCTLCASIADGVDYLHKEGVVHGDLKPENILVAKDHIPKLTDFGNAALSEYTLQFSQSNATQNMTLRWAAPEIVQGITRSTQEGDVYALGMVIFETISGILPYEGAMVHTVLYKIMNGEAPSRPEAHIPTGIEKADRLWALITSCWAKSPSGRPKAYEVKNVMDEITPDDLVAKSK